MQVGQPTVALMPYTTKLQAYHDTHKLMHQVEMPIIAPSFRDFLF